MICGDAAYAPPPPAGGGGSSTAVAGSPVLGAATASFITSPPATVECVVWPGGGGSEDDGNRGAPVAAPVMSLATSWVHPAALPKWPLRALDLHSVPACGARLPPRHHLRLAVYLSPLPPSGAAPTPPPPAVLLPYGNPRVQLVATPTICRLPLAR